MKHHPHVQHTIPVHTAHWTRQAASKIQATPANRFPAFDVGQLRPLMPNHHVWDSWFVMTEEGQVADIHGFRVLVALTRPLTASSGEGEKIGYFYSKDGVHYHIGGMLLPQSLYADAREWSGSTILRKDGRLQTFYTIATGVQIDGIWQTSQRFATAIQSVSIEGDGAGQRLLFGEPTYHSLLAEPDGDYYETVQQASQREANYPTRHRLTSGDEQSENLCFRDPKFYRDAKTGKAYLLFEGNTGTRFCPAGSVRREYIGSSDFEPNYTPTPDDLKANGCVGVLELTNADYTYGIFMPPWMTTNLVTDEIERINLLPCNGSLYLFVVAHGNKCTLLSENADLMNRDYMIGFRAKHLFGPLEPLNTSGVIVQQKSFGNSYAGQDDNQQYVYSWLMVPTEQKNVFDCITYANFSVDANGASQRVKTAGPTVKIEIDGLQTRIVDKSYNISPVN